MSVPVFNLIKSGCEQVRAAASFFMANLIHYQYIQQRKKDLIDMVFNVLASGEGYILRKAFITFCT